MAGNTLTQAALGAGVVAATRALRRRRAIAFQDKVVVITGGSRGLGLLIARELAGEGARLALIARDGADLREAEEDLRARGAQVAAFAADVTDQGAAEDAIARARDRFGPIDILINDAGVIQAGPLENQQIADFEEAMRVHFWAPLYTMQAVLPEMRERHAGRIVNISSIGGKIAVPHLAPYCASKFALTGLSDAVRAEVAKDGIQVTTVCPGLMRTGSPPNAFFKGRHKQEYTLFTILGSSRLFTIDAGRAARQIVEACRYGDPELTISVQAQFLARVNALAPRLTAGVMAVVTRALPRAAGPAGDQKRTGWQSRTPLAPSVLTRLSDEATRDNNELRGHADIQ
jgi:NAD(P)-dependent dehydrogenase (short-subunit alcohol dehydrogenase family)